MVIILCVGLYINPFVFKFLPGILLYNNPTLLYLYINPSQLYYDIFLLIDLTAHLLSRITDRKYHQTDRHTRLLVGERYTGGSNVSFSFLY